MLTNSTARYTKIFKADNTTHSRSTKNLQFQQILLEDNKIFKVDNTTPVTNNSRKIPHQDVSVIYVIVDQQKNRQFQQILLQDTKIFKADHTNQVTNNSRNIHQQDVSMNLVTVVQHKSTIPTNSTARHKGLY